MAAMPSARSIGVGAFVLGGLLLFSVALFLIGNRRMLFSSNFEIYAEFKTISGIEVGSTVRVSGMNAGEVKDIQVPTRPDARFRLRLQVREDLHPLVRTDSIATIQTQGLVGAQFLEVGAGTAHAAAVRPGGTIRSEEPLEVADLLKQMSDTVRTVNDTILLLRGDIEQTIATIQQTGADADNLIKKVSGDLTEITNATARVTNDISGLVAGVRAGRGTVGKLFTDEELYRSTQRIVANVEQTLAAAREAADRANAVLKGAGGKGGTVDTVAGGVTETLVKAQESMQNLADVTEALKHNFLLRGFFRNRGYFNLAALSPHEYRRGALESSGRRPLHVWIGAERLFAAAEDGTEAVTDEGKALLDSAMGQFLAYRGMGPLIVEGYAEGGDAAHRYLRSRQRAAAVRGYLLARFKLDPDSTGALALGSEAKGSPAGAKWDGVALALFVDPDRLVRD